MLIREAAIRLLARREHSRREMVQKLRKRGFASADIHPLLSQLEQDNLLSETRFIGMMVRTRTQKGVGPLKIIAELQKHGVSQKDIENDEDWQNTDWITLGQKALIKRFGEAVSPNDSATQIQLKRFLNGRGFKQEQIKEILKGVLCN